MTPRTVAIALLLAGLSLDACVTAPSCVPVALVVVAKERRTRVGLQSGTLQSTPTGQIREVHDSFVPEYWIKDSQGRWHQVPEATWRTTELGQGAEVCR